MHPSYIAFDDIQREQYLSQLGTFSPRERELFHLACANWQPRIPFQRFASAAGISSDTPPADLVRLFQKLREERVGLMRTRVEENKRIPDALVLADPSSPQFFVELVDEYFVDMRESVTGPPAMESRILKEVESAPEGTIQTVDSKTLGACFSEGAPEERVLRIATSENEAFLIRAHNLKPAVAVAMARLRYLMTSPNALAMMAKIMDTNLLTIKQQLAGKDPSFWLQFTDTVQNRKRDILAHRDVRLEASFFHFVALLRAVIQGQIDHAAEVKREKEELQADCEAIAQGIKESPEGFVDQVQLNRMLDSQKDKYGDKHDAFREAFFERHVKVHGKNTLPTVLIMAKRYVHRDNIFPMFGERFREVSGELHHRFVTEMEHQLKTNNRNKSSIFFSQENFDDAIKEAVTDLDWLLGAILKRPAILAEAIIWHAKQNKLATDVEGIRQRLSVYFDPDTLQPLPPHEWFNLHMFSIFEAAFERLHVVKRLWIRLTGKYDSFRSRYIGEESIGSKVASTGSGGATGGGSPNTRGVVRSGAAGGGGRSQTRADRKKQGRSGSGKGDRKDRGAASQGSGSVRASKSRAKAPPKPKSYSKRQLDSAWEEFGKSVKKKPED